MEHTTQHGTVYLQDCLEGLKKLPTNSVDVSFTSPPYNESGNDIKDTNSHTKYLYTEHRDDWLEWQVEVIKQLLRVSKRYVLYNIGLPITNRQNVYKLIGMFSKYINNIVVWDKVTATPSGTPNVLSSKYEILIVFGSNVRVNSKFMWNMITTESATQNEYSDVHKATMNREFCNKVIDEFTKPNDIVLDPFGGTGTTFISCIERDRHFIGYEFVEDYYNIITERIDESESLFRFREKYNIPQH